MKPTIQTKHLVGAFGIISLPFSCLGHAEETPEKPATAPATDQAAPVPSDESAIQGLWKLTHIEAGGQKGPAEIMEIMRYEFKGDKVIITPTETGETTYTFKLDPAAKPATITCTPLQKNEDGDMSHGIYRLEGDILTMCFGKTERPAHMKIGATAPGEGLMILERVKP